MEKRLLKKIRNNFIFMCVVIISVYSLNSYKKYKDMIFYDFDQLLNQVINNYEESQDNFKDQIAIYEEDYLNRVEAIDFILKNNADMRNNEGLTKIKNLMGIDSISLVDHNGEIIFSNEEDVIGINLLEHEESKAFWDLIKGTDKNDSVFDIDSKNIIENKQKCFVGIKSSIDDYSIIQIGFSKNIVTELEKEESIGTVLNKTPTTYITTIFALDKTNGEILGITKNNEQSINFDGIESNEKLIELLEKASEGKILKINGSYKFLKSRIVDNMILVNFIDSKHIFNQIIIQFLYCVGIVCFIFFVLMFTLKRYFKKYVFDDFDMIERDIKKIVSGKLDIYFKAKNTELQSLVETLNKWKDSYKHKSSRMSKIINSIDENIGLFECLHYINKNFFSDNLQSILGIDDLKWNEIKESPKIFEEYIKVLMTLADDDGIIYINNKCLSIKSYTMENEFFGAIVDKSKEIEKNKELKEIKYIAEKDTLTNLLNRSAFEKYVEKSFLKNPGKGTMLIFDLDNFKQINDKIGHPEGDRVLRIMSCCLNCEFREGELIARLGGDEFVVFFDYNVPIEILHTKLESILGNIRKRLARYYKDYNVSTSIGVAYVDNKIHDYKDLYRCSDVALYIAKQLGKDRYHVNEDNIRCMRGKCIECTDDCKRRKLLGLENE